MLESPSAYQVQIKAEEHLQNNMMRELGLRQALLTACNPEEMFHSDIQRIINETLDTVSPQSGESFP